ncbi:tannase and feruloyl esterase [Seiridium cupressi]
MESISVSPDLCTASTFPYPTVFGSGFLSLEASLVQNYITYVSDELYSHNPELFLENATFCNVTISHADPGQEDVVYVESWLPIPWGRFQTVGGGGWTAGRSDVTESEMAGAMGNG